MKNSVVITTYNGEKYITEQLDSIKNQTLPPDEVIIRDDGSKDDTPQVIRDYIAYHHLDNWDFQVNKHNKGFFDNFMDAVRDCTGDVIYLADQDDVWDIRKIATFTRFYDTHPQTMMVQSNICFIDEQCNGLPSKELYHGKEMSSKPSILNISDMFRFAGSGYTMSFRKQVADTVFKNGFDKKKNCFVFHDILLGQTAAVLGDCYLVTSIVDSHRLHSGNETQRNGKSYLSDRTKGKQIEILRNRHSQCRNMLTICRNKNKVQYIKDFLQFTENRLNLIEGTQVQRLPYLIRNSGNYASKKGIVTDMMYALGMEKILLMVYSKI